MERCEYDVCTDRLVAVVFVHLRRNVDSAPA